MVPVGGALEQHFPMFAKLRPIDSVIETKTSMVPGGTINQNGGWQQRAAKPAVAWRARRGECLCRLESMPAQRGAAAVRLGRSGLQDPGAVMGTQRAEHRVLSLASSPHTLHGVLCRVCAVPLM